MLNLKFFETCNKVWNLAPETKPDFGPWKIINHDNGGFSVQTADGKAINDKAINNLCPAIRDLCSIYLSERGGYILKPYLYTFRITSVFCDGFGEYDWVAENEGLTICFLLGVEAHHNANPDQKES